MQNHDASEEIQSKKPRQTRSRLSSRAPVKHRHEAEQLRRYPPTKVLVPAGLHSESCSSLFSAWDIDTEAADGGCGCPEAGVQEAEEQEKVEQEKEVSSSRRAPLASFRLSYILTSEGSCRDPGDYISQPRSPPVTLQLSPFLLLFPTSRPPASKQNSVDSTLSSLGSASTVLSHVQSASQLSTSAPRPPRPPDHLSRSEQRLAGSSSSAARTLASERGGGDRGQINYSAESFNECGGEVSRRKEPVNITVNTLEATSLPGPGDPCYRGRNGGHLCNGGQQGGRLYTNTCTPPVHHLYTNPLDKADTITTASGEDTEDKSHSNSTRLPSAITLLCNDEVIQLSSGPSSPAPAPAPGTAASSGSEAGASQEQPSWREAQDQAGSSIPVAVGCFVATVVGTPVLFAAGIKLGMFAGIAGGAMGYTTGKMFADHEEAQAVAKGLVLEEGEEVPPAMKKKQILKRIREWERFEANCHMLRELDREKRKLRQQLEGRRRHHSAGAGLLSTRRRGSVQQEGGSAGEVRAHGLRKVRSEAGHLSPTYTEDTGPGRGGDVVL